MQTFIIVHNQNIIIDFEKYQKFYSIKNLQYVLVGDGESEKIQHLNNIIICKNLIDNIEINKNLLSFTGWYAIWKNNLIHSNYVNLLEYDINFSSKFITLEENIHNLNPIIGYIRHNVHDEYYLKRNKFSGSLIVSIKKHYGIDIIDFINRLPKDFNCTMTSNHTFRTDIFDRYMNWVIPMIEDFKSDYLAGHQLERSISMFYLLHQIPYSILDDFIYHYQLDSHRTQFKKYRFKNNYCDLLNLK